MKNIYIYLIVLFTIILTMTYVSSKYLISYNIVKSLLTSIYYVYLKPKMLKDKTKIPDQIKIGCDYILENLNLNIKVHGKPNLNEPILFVANHGSYIDPIILKSINPKLMTISKDDANKEFFLSGVMTEIMNNWGTILYKRGDKKSGKAVRLAIADCLTNKNRPVLVFPEGKAISFGFPKTFYPGSFEVAKENNIKIQPVTIKYSGNIGWGIKSIYNKKHNESLLHNIDYLTNRKHDIHVTFHPVIDSKLFNDGKHIRDYCHYVITDEWMNQHHYKL